MKLRIEFKISKKKSEVYNLCSHLSKTIKEIQFLSREKNPSPNSPFLFCSFPDHSKAPTSQMPQSLLQMFISCIIFHISPPPSTMQGYHVEVRSPFPLLEFSTTKNILGTDPASQTPNHSSPDLQVSFAPHSSPDILYQKSGFQATKLSHINQSIELTPISIHQKCFLQSNQHRKSSPQGRLGSSVG